MRWRVRVGYPVAVIYWVLARPTLRSIAMGGIIAVIGLLIRGISSGYLRKDQELATAGPYAYSRNPLYFGSSLLAVGFAVAGRSWWAGVLVVADFAVFYYAVMRNEEEDLRKRFGETFGAYAKRVPLFFPAIIRASAAVPAQAVPGPARRFSWTQYRRNREYKALIGTLAGIAILFVRMWLRMRWGH